MVVVKYQNIKSPQELLVFMDDIRYGWLTCGNEVILGKRGGVWAYEKNDKIVESENSMWLNQKIMSARGIVKYKLGICVDQVELERDFFESNNYKYEIYDIAYRTENSRSGHAFLVFKDSDGWSYFEHSSSNNRGINKFKNKTTCLKYAVDCFMKNHQLKDEQTIELRKTPESFSGMNQKKRLLHILKYRNTISEII